MRPNTIIELADGRRGTICYHNLDGYGGVFGEHDLNVDDLPRPQFMLREKSVEKSLQRRDAWGLVVWSDLECVGEEYEVIDAMKEQK